MALEVVAPRVEDWIEVSGTDTALILRIGGSLDAISRDSIEPAVLAAISSARSVIIDLADLTFCDASGVAMFIAAQAQARNQETSIAFRHVIGPVRRIFEIAGPDTVIEFRD